MFCCFNLLFSSVSRCTFSESDSAGNGLGVGAGSGNLIGSGSGLGAGIRGGCGSCYVSDANVICKKLTDTSNVTIVKTRLVFILSFHRDIRRVLYMNMMTNF